MNPTALPQAQSCYTAQQLAGSLCLSKPTVQKALEQTPSQLVQASGNETRGWQFVQLPQQWQEKIAKRAYSNGLAIHEYLDSSARQWEPKQAFCRQPEEVRQKTLRLQRALLPTVKRFLDDSISRSEVWRLAAEEFKAEFGFAGSDKLIRSKVKEAIRRARWDENYERPELFLEEVAPQPAPKPVRDEFRALRSLINGIVAAGTPTRQQKRQIFDDAFVLLIDLGDQAEAAKPDLVAFLTQHAPFLGKTPAAIHRAFNRLYAQWKQGGQSLAALDVKWNGRARGPKLTQEETDALIAYSAKYDGRDQGWREAIRAGKLRQEVVAYYAKTPRDMPRKIREQITRPVDYAKIRLHGPREAALRGPYINRDPNHPEGKLHSGDWDQCDDYTFVNAAWDVLEDGTVYVGQPQLLLWVDERSWLHQGFVLIPARSYNAFDIRNSWTRKCDDNRMPREGLYLEGSFWQSARVWVGKKDEVAWSETEEGIRRLGLRVKRAIYPRGKVIERIFKIVQSYLQAEPGFAGTNPLTDRYEKVQEQIRLARSGQVHPRDFGWLSIAEWKVRLGEILTIYGNEPGEGKYLNGLSPKQAYEAHFDHSRGPLQRVPDECRYLLACNKIAGLSIGANGLSFQYGRRRFTYKDERLGQMRMRNEKAIAWFNPENPELCGVTDEHGENPIVVRRETTVPNHDAPPESLNRAYAENASMERAAKEVYGRVKHVFSADFEKRRTRPVIANAGSVAAIETQAAFEADAKRITQEDRHAESAIQSAEELPIGGRLQRNDPRLSYRAKGKSKLAKLFRSAKPDIQV
jgi:hypothetical protein